MSIIQTQTTSFKTELYEGIHNLLSDTLYMALYTGNVSLNNTTTVYTTSNEITGTGYTAGGIQVTGATVSNDGNYTAYVNFNNVTWPNSNLTARCALLYNVSKSNRSICVIDFGSNKTMANFTITMPANTSTTALIRSSN